MTEVVISGNGLDALACSLRLSQLAIPHYWSPEGEPGGHFAGWRGGCRDMGPLDLGMVLLEPGPEYSSLSHFRDYACEEGAATRKFLPSVFSWIQETTGLILEEHPIYTRFRGSSVRDVFVGDELEVLSILAPDERAKIASELGAIIAEGQAITESSRSLETDTLLGALRRSLGQTLLKTLFAEYLSKFPAAADIPFQLHRQVWLPMYWTQTVLRALNSGEQNLPPARFLAPKSSSVAEMIHGLANLAFASDFRLTAHGTTRTGLVTEFSSTGRGGHFRQKYTIVHLCVAGELARSTFFFADLPGGVARLSLYPANTGAQNQDSVEYVAAVEIPGSEDWSPEQFLAAAGRALRDVGGEPTCTGALKQVNFWFGPPDNSLSGCGGLSINENLLRGLSAAEKISAQHG